MLIHSAKETEALARAAHSEDHTYFVPAFTGLGAPYWAPEAEAVLSGMTRVTGKAELVRAALDGIAYQIADLVFAMEQDTGVEMKEVRVDGGPTGNAYLMQFQSDILNKQVSVSGTEELSGIGAAYLAGISIGLYQQEKLFQKQQRVIYEPKMDKRVRSEKIEGWKRAVQRTLKG